jgi:hypothetical protein
MKIICEKFLDITPDTSTPPATYNILSLETAAAGSSGCGKDAIVPPVDRPLIHNRIIDFYKSAN